MGDHEERSIRRSDARGSTSIGRYESGTDHCAAADTGRTEATPAAACPRHQHRTGDRGRYSPNATCLANGYKTTALITDSAGIPIVLISNDGAAAITQRIAMSKAQATLKYGMTSGEVAAKAAADTAFAAEIKANPLIETARRGAIPIKAGSDLIGTFAVSGAPGGDKDEVCAVAGLAKIQDRIK